MSRLTRLALLIAGTAVPLAAVAPAFAGYTLDITISKTHTGNFTAGKNGTFTITLNATGSGSTDGNDTFTVTDSLPSGLTFVSGGGSGFSCSASGQTVTCTGSVAMQGSSSQGTSPSSISFPLTVHVAPNAPDQVTNNVSFTESQNADQNKSDNTAQDTVVIVHPTPSPTPSPTKSPSPTPSATQTSSSPAPAPSVLPTSSSRLPTTGGGDLTPVAMLGGVLLLVGAASLGLGLRSRRAR